MANINIPRTEFAAALAQVASERGIDPSAVLESIKLAIITAYKKDYGTSDELEYDVLIDSVSGESRLFSWPIGQERGESWSYTALHLRVSSSTPTDTGGPLPGPDPAWSRHNG